jgi:hypothetical protein
VSLNSYCLVLRSRMFGALPSCPLHAFRIWCLGSWHGCHKFGFWTSSVRVSGCMLDGWDFICGRGIVLSFLPPHPDQLMGLPSILYFVYHTFRLVYSPCKIVLLYSVSFVLGFELVGCCDGLDHKSRESGVWSCFSCSWDHILPRALMCE